MSTALDIRRHQFVHAFQRARALTDSLFNLVRPESLTDRPIPERHRIIFYLGHFEAFEWNMIGRRVFDLPPVDPTLDDLFAFGIDPLDGKLPQDSPSDWPQLQLIEKYRQKVRRAVDECLHRTVEHPVFQAALEHRLMHAETLQYMLHWVPYENKSLRPAPVRDVMRSDPRSVEIPAGDATLGVTQDLEAPFAWDNEYEPHSVFVPAFSIDAHNVTNGQYLRFVENGGEPPKFWVLRQGQWWYRTMFAEIPLQLSWPVYVSHTEATTFAKSYGRSLPTEAQYHRAAFGAPDGTERKYPWGALPPDSAKGNFNFDSWNPAPVGSYPAGESAFGVADLMGNGWEWTSTTFHPFPGFTPFDFYPGYSANFFDDRHYVLKGASPQTDSAFLRRSFRNWFQPNYPYVYATFRCVDN